MSLNKFKKLLLKIILGPFKCSGLQFDYTIDSVGDKSRPSWRVPFPAEANHHPLNTSDYHLELEPDIIEHVPKRDETLIIMHDAQCCGI